MCFVCVYFTSFWRSRWVDIRADDVHVNACYNWCMSTFGWTRGANDLIIKHSLRLLQQVIDNRRPEARAIVCTER